MVGQRQRGQEAADEAQIRRAVARSRVRDGLRRDIDADDLAGFGASKKVP